MQNKNKLIQEVTISYCHVKSLDNLDKLQDKVNSWKIDQLVLNESLRNGAKDFDGWLDKISSRNGVIEISKSRCRDEECLNSLIRFLKKKTSSRLDLLQLDLSFIFYSRNQFLDLLKNEMKGLNRTIKSFLIFGKSCEDIEDVEAALRLRDHYSFV